MSLRPRMTLIAILTFITLLAASPRPACAKPIDEVLPETTRPRLTDRTYVFSRSQFKYGLHRNDFLSRWVDRPLLTDPALAEKGNRQPIQYTSFAKQQKIVQAYGLDGMAFFPTTSGRAQIYGFTEKANQPGFMLLTEVFPDPKGFDKQLEVIGQAIDNPASFRIDGKVVITTYRGDSRPPEFWEKWLKDVRAAHGDKIIFLPNLIGFADQSIFHWRDRFDNQELTETDIQSLKEYVRSYLRVADGVYFVSTAMMKNHDRNHHDAFYRDFVIRLLKSVLAEPAFKDKYFGLSANVGHENGTRIGYAQSSQGTRTLRHSFEIALEANPDFISIPEWDEQNENTSLRPTVYNSFSSLRIMRYYMAGIKGQPLAPLAGDDTSIPNLVISYRKVIMLGEEMQIELLHIPDGSSDGPVQAQVELLDQDHKAVFTSDPVTFTGDRMVAHVVTLPAQTMAAHHVLLPRLVVQAAGRKQVYDQGLHYIDLRATWNWDYKWVKQPLRDLMPSAQTTFTMQPAGEGDQGLAMATVAIQSPEPLISVELLENDNTIYMHAPQDAGPSWRETADTAVLCIAYESLETFRLKGRITLQGAQGRWKGHAPVDGQSLVLDNQRTNVWIRNNYVAIPKDALDQAVLDIQIPGVHEGKIPVSRIMKDRIIGFTGEYGFNVVISRYVHQDDIPHHLNETQVRFAVPVLADLPRSVMHVQAISQSGKTYRSEPLILGEKAGEDVAITVYSSTQEKPVTLKVDASRVPDIDYDFTPRHGSIVTTPAGRTFYGAMGGSAVMASGRGGGESGRDGLPFIRQGHYPANTPNNAPTWQQLDDGRHAIVFDGVGTYMVLPQGVIPRRSAFTIHMKINPQTIEGKQLIIANRAHYGGSLSVYLVNGEIQASFQPERSQTDTRARTGVMLQAGQWQDLTLHYDQQALTITLDGRQSQPFLLPGPGLYDMVTVLGGFADAWFKGMITDLHIRHW